MYKNRTLEARTRHEENIYVLVQGSMKFVIQEDCAHRRQAARAQVK